MEDREKTIASKKRSIRAAVDGNIILMKAKFISIFLHNFKKCFNVYFRHSFYMTFMITVKCLIKEFHIVLLVHQCSDYYSNTHGLGNFHQNISLKYLTVEVV